jgi:hypothetical protein
MTMSGGEFVCDSCAQSFPLNLTTIVRKQVEGPDAEGVELTFHDPDCSLEYERRGGKPTEDSSGDTVG